MTHGEHGAVKAHGAVLRWFEVLSRLEYKQASVSTALPCCKATCHPPRHTSL